MKIVKRFQLKIVIFAAVKKSLYIAWVYFRNGFNLQCLTMISQLHSLYYNCHVLFNGTTAHVNSSIKVAQ